MSIDPFSLDSYDYDLPEERIAQYPPERRGSSRLLVLDKNGPDRVDALFADLPAYLPEGAVLVANNSARGPAAARRNCCCSRLLLWWKGRPAPKAGTVFPLRPKRC